jgi:hypothetical protein
MFDNLANYLQGSIKMFEQSSSSHGNTGCDNDRVANIPIEDLVPLLSQLDDGPYERLDEVLRSERIGNRHLATLAGLHESQISRGLGEHHGLERHWPRIALVLNLSLNWLLFGRGPVGFTVATTMPPRSAASDPTSDLHRKITALADHHASLGGELAHLRALLGEDEAADAEPSGAPDPRPATDPAPDDGGDSHRHGSAPGPTSPRRRHRRR